jgi:hypothetical protein
VIFEQTEQAQRGPPGLPPASRPELLHVLMLPDFDRADAIGSYWGNPKTRAFAELLIDCEEDRVFRAVLVGMLGRRTANLGPSPPPHGEPIVWRSNRRLRAPGLPLYLPKGRRPGWYLLRVRPAPM